MNMKRTVAVFTVLALSLGAVSCSKEPEAEITDTTLPTESTIPSEIYEFVSENTRYIDPENCEDVKPLVQEAVSGLERAILVRNANGFLDREYLNSLDYGSFWVDSYSYFDYEAGENIYTVYIFNYNGLTAEELSAMKEEIDSEMFRLIGSLSAGATDTWKKTRAVHDELIDRTEYTGPGSSDNSDNIYGALVEHSASSAGYAFAMRQILNAMGISSSVVVSDVHSWVRIDDDYGDVFIDAGMDDTVNTDSQGRPYRNYDYFGLTEQEVRQIDPSAYFVPTEGGRSGFNYYAHGDYMFSEFGAVEITNAFRDQYEGNTNILTVRFDNEDAYAQALDFFSDATRTWNVLHSAGVTETDCWKTHNDETLTFSIGLDTAQEETEDTEEST